MAKMSFKGREREVAFKTAQKLTAGDEVVMQIYSVEPEAHGYKWFVVGIELNAYDRRSGNYCNKIEVEARDDSGAPVITYREIAWRKTIHSYDSRTHLHHRIATFSS